MRVFVGIALPEAVRDAVHEHVERQRRDLPSARWVNRENYHITLVFLGEREGSEAQQVESALAPVFGGSRPFVARLASAGAFPPQRPARVLWIGMERAAPLRELHSRVVAALPAGLATLEDRRPYHAHVTVARCKRPWPRAAVQRWVAALPGAIGESFEVDRGVLFESRLHPDGARYRELRTFRFEEAAP